MLSRGSAVWYARRLGKSEEIEVSDRWHLISRSSPAAPRAGLLNNLRDESTPQAKPSRMHFECANKLGVPDQLGTLASRSSAACSPGRL
jgi:hypothetical protein